jgi:hypothetical protein
MGDCECCIKSINVELHLHDSMWMCNACETDHLTAKKVSVEKIMDDVNKYDTPTNMKMDVHLARTMPIIELRAQIEQDENIPTDQKLAVFTQIGYERFLAKKQAIFDQQQKLAEDQDEARLWQVNLQEAVGKLRVEERAKYSDLNISYAPAPITKKQKSTKPVGPGKEKPLNKKELFAAAEKYGVPSHNIRSIMVRKGWTADQAGQHLANLLK